MKLPFQKALITGGAGFIGSHIAEALINAGCTVNIIDNLSTGHLINLDGLKDRITFFQEDIRNADAVNAAAKDCEVIFHLAAQVSVPQSVEDPVASAMINEIGMLNVLQAARNNGVKKIVFSSSSAVYGDDPVMPKKEDMLPCSLSPYAVQKLSGEEYAKVYGKLFGIGAVSLRYFNVFGPRQDPSSPYSGVISIFMNLAIAEKSPLIYGDGEQYRDFVFVKDVVKANLLAASSDKADGRSLNIGTGIKTTINALWDQVRNLAGSNADPEYEPARNGDIRESVAAVDLASSVLEFNADCLFADGLKLTFDWYKNN